MYSAFNILNFKIGGLGLKETLRTRQVGASAILIALVLRLFDPGSGLMTYFETGRNVRFSSSLALFSPDFVESPAPLAPEPEIQPLPTFSGEENVEIYYAAKVRPDIPALLSQPLDWQLQGSEPTVLILHTHSTESYTQGEERYVETSAFRTLDEEFNMLCIGRRVGELLAEGGITAIQDRKIHDYPSYNSAYSDARSSLKEYLQCYPSIRLVLDLHRDASGTEEKQMRTSALVNGRESAQLMVVLGTNHAGFEENLSLGLKLHAQLEQLSPGITRPLQLRASRFNQDLSPGALLVEVGSAGNSREEALFAAHVLAQSILALARGTGGGVPLLT